MSFLADSVHEPLAPLSEVVHNVVVDSLIVTLPVGGEPEYYKETVTNARLGVTS